MAILQTSQFGYTHLTGLATTVIFTPQVTNQGSSAVLHTININTKGAASNTLSIYNNTSAVAADLIAVVDTTTGVNSLFYDIVCPQGITIVSATGTGADITVAWTKLNQI